MISSAIPADSRTDDTNDTSAGPEIQPSASPRRTLIMRVVAGLTVLFTIWHLFASFLWIAPVSPLRELIPGNALSSYMLPMFGQSWSVFAPAPINGDYELQVRALVGEGDDLTETEWVDASQIETTSMHTHNLFPPRASTGGLQLASAVRGEWDDLSEDQQKVVELGFYKGNDWSDRLSFHLSEAGDAATAAKYMNVDAKATAYATQVARAVWGDSVQAVQFKITRQNIVPFEERHNAEAVRPDVQQFPTGWRGVLVRPGQSDERFADQFLPMYRDYMNAQEAS